MKLADYIPVLDAARPFSPYRYRMQLTVYVPDGDREVVGYFRTKHAAVEAFFELALPAEVRGRVESISGVKTIVHLPERVQEHRESAAMPRTLRRKQPLVREGVSQASIGATIHVTAWGETKTLYAWSRDPRAQAPFETIRCRLGRTRVFWTTEAAISTPGKATRQRQTNKRRAAMRAFGEAKTINDWAADPRCKVTAMTLRKRLAAGVRLEEALEATVSREFQKWPMHEAFGCRKSLLEWSRDPRCTVSYERLRKGVRAGRHIEDIFAEGPPGTYLAFDERKTLAAWANDERCAVTREGLAYRLRHGMSIEEAIVSPADGTMLRRRTAAADRT